MAFNILLVDDSAIVRSVIAKTIELSGVPVQQILQASNGQEGLEILNSHWIDLVFLDINMPVMGGVEMIDKMAQDGLMKTVPVVIVSTEGSAVRIEELKAKGVCGYLRKPFTPEQIKNVVQEIMERQNGYMPQGDH